MISINEEKELKQLEIFTVDYLDLVNQHLF